MGDWLKTSDLLDAAADRLERADPTAVRLVKELRDRAETFRAVESYGSQRH